MRQRNMHVKTDTHWRLSEKMVRNKNGGNIAISGPDCHAGTSRSLDEMMTLTRLADRVCSATTDAERFGKDYSP